MTCASDCCFICHCCKADSIGLNQSTNLWFFLKLICRNARGLNKGQGPVEWGEIFYVGLSLRPSVPPSPPKAKPLGLWANQPGLARQAAGSPSQGLMALEPALRSTQPGLRISQALGLSTDGRADGWMYGWMDSCTVFLPILQDFVTYRGCCQPEKEKPGKGTADHLMPLGNW